MRYLTVTELSKKYNVSYQKVYRLIREGLPHQIEFKTILTKRRTKRLGERTLDDYKIRKKVILVKEEDWLEIPTFLRNKLIKKSLEYRRKEI